MNYEIVESFAQMVRERGIDRDILSGIVEDIFSMLMRKKYGPDARFDIVVNMERGDIAIYLERTVVETVNDANLEIDLETARQKSSDPIEVGEEFVEEMDLSSFGRRLIASAKQNLNQRIKEIEKETIYREYSSIIGEIVVGEIYQVRRGEVFVIHNRNELVMPKQEQIFRERYRKGDTLRALVKEVRRDSGGPSVIISRADPAFLRKLFELEIPEVFDGIIELKAIAREPGERAKVAVESHNDRIDPVGACVGMKGVRIHAIVRELSNENIDVVNYSDEPSSYIARALSPARPVRVEIDKAAKKATVVVPNEQLALAIGRNGQNIRLASKLTGYELNVVKEREEPEYDIELIEFKEELGETLYLQFIEAGYDTVQELLSAKREEILKIEGLTAERLDEITAMMREELEGEEEEETASGEVAETKEEEEEETASGEVAETKEEEETKEKEEEEAPAAEAAKTEEEELGDADEDASEEEKTTGGEPPGSTLDASKNEGV
ncbi:MAG: transcription termination/antitermination protein NusA [Ignavibacteriales bacterium CG07_land_8_20_14_0_80_59_12]|nr:MAG: transcription termination/antitermination protein NusA [Ignavibacteriales bacterium CG07_land_8_20_14_0_80_59_12]